MNVLMALGAIVIGGLFSGYFAYQGYESRRFQRHALSAIGLIVDYTHRLVDWWDTETKTYRKAYIFSAIVRFVTAAGEQVETAIELDNRRPKVGRNMRILYNPEDPRDARKDSLAGRGTCVSVFAVLFGFVFVVGGVIGLFNSL